MKKTPKNSKIERNILPKSLQAQNCSNSLEITPQLQGESRSPFPRRVRRAIPTLKPEPLPKELQKLFAQKPQIVSIPGVSLTARKRYRVLLEERIIGDSLTLDEALKLAKGGKN